MDLIVRLARYQEEGIKLAPQVYLTDDIDLLVNMLPDGEKVSFSLTTPNARGVEEMLKICAPLVIGEWRVFGHQTEQGMQYGVFRGSGNPISIEVDDILLSEQGETTVIKAHQVADECVQIRSSKGHYHYVFFNHRKEESPPPLQYIENLIQCMVKNVNSDEKEAVQGFMKKIVMSALLKSHGCILAVTNMKTPPVVLSHDAVLLREPIDFPSMIRQLKSAKNTGSWLQFIEGKAELVRGMICSDGITLFDEYGRLLGYRCFISLPRDSGVVGGARRRAFETLKRHLGRGLSAAFVQSQDGWTDFGSKYNE